VSHNVAPSALNLLAAFPSPRSRTGLPNPAASRLVEWFHSTTENLARKKNKKLSVCFAEVPQRRAKNFLRGSLRQFFAPFAVIFSFSADHPHYHKAARFVLFTSLFTLSPYFSSAGESRRH